MPNQDELDRFYNELLSKPDAERAKLVEQLREMAGAVDDYYWIVESHFSGSDPTVPWNLEYTAHSYPEAALWLERNKTEELTYRIMRYGRSPLEDVRI